MGFAFTQAFVVLGQGDLVQVCFRGHYANFFHAETHFKGTKKVAYCAFEKKHV